MKKRTASFLCGLTLTIGLMVGAMPAMAASLTNTAIDETVFPDGNLCGYVLNHIDLDKNSILSPEEIAGVTALDISGKNIANLQGLDLFENLKELNCADNLLSGIPSDVLAGLDALDCSGNSITAIDLDGAPALKYAALYGSVLDSANDIAYTAGSKSLKLDKTVQITVTAPSLETTPMGIHWDGTSGKIRWEGSEESYNIRILTNLDNGEYRRTGKAPAASEWGTLAIDTFLMYSGEQTANEFDITKLLDTDTLQHRFDVYNEMVRNGQTKDQYYVNRMDPYNKTGIFVSRAGTANVGGMFCVEIDFDKTTNFGDDVHFKNSSRIWIDYSSDCYPSEVLNARLVDREDGVYLQWDPIVNVTADDTLRITADGLSLSGNVNLYSVTLPATAQEVRIQPVIDMIHKQLIEGTNFILGFGLQFEVIGEDEGGNRFLSSATDFFSMSDVEDKEVVGHWDSADDGFVFSWGEYSLRDLGLDLYDDMTKAELILVRRSLTDFTTTMENEGREVYSEVLPLKNGVLAAGRSDMAEQVLEFGDGWYEALIRTIPAAEDRSGSVITSTKMRMFRLRDHVFFSEQSPANGTTAFVGQNGALSLHYTVNFPDWLRTAGYELVFSDVTVVDGDDNVVAVYPVVDADGTLMIAGDASENIGEYFVDYSVELVQTATGQVLNTLSASFDYVVTDEIRAEIVSHSVIYIPNGGTGKMAMGTLIADEENYATLRFPDCDFNAPDGKFFDSWEWKYEDEFWDEASTAMPGSRVRVNGDITVRPVWAELKGRSVSGHVTSFGEETDEITLTLVKEGEVTAAYTAVVTGKSTDYLFDDVEDGTYVLKIEKRNHATRTYDIVVAKEDVLQDVSIRLIGDVSGDGKVNAKDHSRIYAHVNKTSLLTGYDMQCADVSGDGKVNAKDHSRLYAHVNKTSPLY